MKGEELVLYWTMNSMTQGTRGTEAKAFAVLETAECIYEHRINRRSNTFIVGPELILFNAAAQAELIKWDLAWHKV